MRVSECNSQTGVSDAAFCRVTVLWRCNRLSLTLNLKQSTDQSVPKRNQSTDKSVSKHGPKHCFGTEAWTEAQTMFRSIPKQCFGINYSMPLNRGHRIAKKRGHRGLANPNPNVNPNPKTKHIPKHGPKHCFGTETWTEAQTMFRSIPKQCFGINYSMRHRIVKKARA